MRGLSPPPKQESPSRALARIVVLLVLASAAGVVIYSAVTIQRIGLVEDVRTAGLDLEAPSVVEGLTINVAVDEGGPTPVVLLHDVDPTGGLILDDLSSALGEPFHGVRIDLPGFGYSDRLPFETSRHTAAGMAEIVAAVLDSRFDRPVHVVGVGFGGEVGADLALTNPELVSGLVLVDVDFWSGPSSLVSLERLPWVGRAATYTWETGGRFGVSNWSPRCDEGAWCPTAEELALRSFIISISATTQSLYEFRRTHEAASAPARLDEIEVPMIYVWSSDGEVPAEIVDRMVDEVPGLQVVDSASFRAHLDDPGSVGTALELLSG